MARLVIGLALSLAACRAPSANPSDPVIEVPAENLRDQSRVERRIAPEEPLEAKASELPRLHRPPQSTQVWLKPEDLPRGVRAQ